MAGESSEHQTGLNLPPELTGAALWVEQWAAPAAYAISLLDKTKK